MFSILFFNLLMPQIRFLLQTNELLFLYFEANAGRQHTDRLTHTRTQHTAGSGFGREGSIEPRESHASSR